MLFRELTVQFCEAEGPQWIDGTDSCKATPMYPMLLSHAPKNGSDSKFFVMCSYHLKKNDIFFSLF